MHRALNQIKVENGKETGVRENKLTKTRTFLILNWNLKAKKNLTIQKVRKLEKIWEVLKYLKYFEIQYNTLKTAFIAIEIYMISNYAFFLLN